VTSNPLQPVREQIDAVDNQILALLVQRMALVDQVIEIKKTVHLPPLQADRFQQMIDRLTAAAQKQGLTAQEIREVWDAIHHASLAHQKTQLTEE
jgi:chorismate mutase